MEEGTRLTIQWAKEYGRPYFHMHLEKGSDPETLPEPSEGLLAEAGTWLEETGPRILNVAGNRESNAPGIRDATVRTLEKLINYLRRT
jgi:hypothetical protein